MAEKQIDLDALRNLLVAVSKYSEDIKENKKILLNAASVCEQAMGSDPISKKKVERLKVALASIDAALSTIEEASQKVIKRKLDDAVDIVNEA